jgi:MFS family permease
VRGVLMIVLDTTIVNVALPSIREDLRFTETSLVWVVNAYMLTFGGFLLLGGRSATCSAIAGCSCSASHCSRWRRSPAVRRARSRC